MLQSCFYDINPSSWISDNGQSCLDAAKQFIITTPGGYQPNIFELQSQMSLVFDKLIGSNVMTSVPAGTFNATSSLLNFCSNLGGACTPKLSSYCNRIDRELISDKNNINSLFCGCISPPNYDVGGSTVLPPQCLPSCQRSGVVPLVSSSNGNKIQCNDSVCILDNVTVDIKDSKVGSVNVAQTCNGCIFGSCRCIISASNGYTLTDLFNAVDNPQEILQFCNNEIQCYQDDKEVDCLSVVPGEKKADSNVPWVVIGTLVIIFLLILLVYVLRSVAEKKKK
jgi:hypothetical protein